VLLTVIGVDRFMKYIARALFIQIIDDFITLTLALKGPAAASRHLKYSQQPQISRQTSYITTPGSALTEPAPTASSDLDPNAVNLAVASEFKRSQCIYGVI
jgi:hypothetical protein